LCIPFAVSDLQKIVQDQWKSSSLCTPLAVSDLQTIYRAVHAIPASGGNLKAISAVKVYGDQEGVPGGLLDGDQELQNIFV